MMDMRSSKAEIGKKLVDFLGKQKKPFYRAHLKDIGMNSTSAKEWLELYELIRKAPFDIRKIELPDTVAYEVINPESKEDEK